MNIARDACGIRTTSSPRVKLMSSLAFDPRFFSPCNCVNSDKKVRDRISSSSDGTASLSLFLRRNVFATGRHIQSPGASKFLVRAHLTSRLISVLLLCFCSIRIQVSPGGQKRFLFLSGLKLPSKREGARNPLHENSPSFSLYTVRPRD